MNDINENLTVSDAPSVRNLNDDHEFDLIVTLGYFDRLGYERPEQSDTGDQYVFPDGDHDYNVFEAAVNHVRDAYERGERVLVHCQAGCSRSPTVASVVLAVENDEPFEIALSRLRSTHDKANPTPELKASAQRYLNEHTEQ